MLADYCWRDVADAKYRRKITTVVDVNAFISFTINLGVTKMLIMLGKTICLFSVKKDDYFITKISVRYLCSDYALFPW